MRIAVIDIGGTKIKSGMWNGKHLTEIMEHNTNAYEGGAKVMDRVIGILKCYHPFDMVGISTAGQVDRKQGSIYYANDNIPGYTGMAVRERIEKEFGVWAEVENDVNAAALGEAYYGAGRDATDFLCLTYGTGVGGAIILNRKIYSGFTWSAGCFGGIVVHPEKMKKEEEFSGCYEKYASATALVRKVKTIDSALSDGRKVFAAIERPEVRHVIDCWIEEVVYGLITLIYVMNPEKIILGGGIMEQDYLIQNIRRIVQEKLSPGFRNIKIEKAGLGNSAGMMGVAWMAEARLIDDKKK